MFWIPYWSKKSHENKKNETNLIWKLANLLNTFFFRKTIAILSSNALRGNFFGATSQRKKDYKIMRNPFTIILRKKTRRSTARKKRSTFSSTPLERLHKSTCLKEFFFLQCFLIFFLSIRFSHIFSITLQLLEMLFFVLDLPRLSLMRWFD